MLEVNKIYNGDCLEKMKDIPDKSIDMILCDLPYGTISCKWDVVIPFNKYVQIGKKVIYEQEYVFDKMKSGVSYKEALEDFLSISKDGLWDNYKRIIKDRGAIVLFGSEPFSSYLRMSNIKNYKYDWRWNKTVCGNPLNNKIRPANVFEDVVVFNAVSYFPIMQEAKKENIRPKSRTKQKTDFVGEYKNGFVQKSDPEKRYPTNNLIFSSRNKECNPLNRLHPTQKPVALLEYLIKTYTLDGETVLDNCMGSGSTGVACINTNRNFIGIEKDDKYFEIAKKRIEEHLTTAST